MSRLYDEWKKQMGHKIPKIFTNTDSLTGPNRRQPPCISIPLKGGPEPMELTERN